MNKKRIFVGLMQGLLMMSLSANELNTLSTQQDTTATLPASDHKMPKAISFRFDNGSAFKTNDYLKRDGAELGYKAYTLQFTFSQPGDSWEYLDDHKGYDGIGFYMAKLDDDAFGDPFSFYVIHGGNLVEFNQRLHLQYEWNLGYSFNWGHYDAIRHPDNITIGASESFHVGIGLFLEWQPLRNFDIKLGGGLTHFSNGASKVPNKGLNLLSPQISLAYRWDDPSYVFGDQKSSEIRDIYNIHRPANYDAHFKHEMTFTISRRQRYMETEGTNLPTENYDHNFRVLGFAYAPMRCPSRKFAYGVSADLVYDESLNAKVNRIVSETDGQVYDNLTLGRTADRLQFGLSAKGEINMHYFSYFGQLGYDLIHSESAVARFYQVMGIQIHPTQKVFATMGIRAVNFSKAQFVYWSIGYSLDKWHKEK